MDIGNMYDIRASSSNVLSLVFDWDTFNSVDSFLGGPTCASVSSVIILYSFNFDDITHT